MISPVDGLMVGNVLPDALLTHWPLMRFGGTDFDIEFDRGRCRRHEVSLLILVRGPKAGGSTTLLLPLGAT